MLESQSKAHNIA